MVAGAGLAFALGRTPGGAAPAVETARAARRDLGSYVKATGVVRPRVGAEVRVGSRASGVVDRLLVRVGESVRKGQLLAELSASELSARRDQAAAALASAEASRRFSEADLTRKRRLAAEGLLAASDLDLAVRAYAAADAQVAEARAGLASAETQLGYVRIHAPIDGVVVSISTQEGETVAASFAAPTFVTLLDLERLEVRAYVDETDVGRIAAGQSAVFLVDTYPGREIEGRVESVDPGAEIRDNVVNYVTVVRFERPKDLVLRPEMTATVRIALEARENVLTVPRRAVRREGGRPFVWLASGERRFVTTGASDDTTWEIRSGLRDGDEVLLQDPKKAEGENAR